jgi:hypothetical protein
MSTFAGLDPGTSATDYGCHWQRGFQPFQPGQFFLLPQALNKTADLNTDNVIHFIRAENTNCFSTVYLLVLTSLVQLRLLLETLCAFLLIKVPL